MMLQGTPVEFPDDITIANESNNVTASTGTTIQWKVQGPVAPPAPPAFAGEHVLTGDLAPGEGLLIAGVLPGGQPAGTACEAEVKPST